MVLVNWWFARTYGWSPDQVGELDLEYLTWLPLIEQAAAHAQELRQRQEERARAGGRGTR